MSETYTTGGDKLQKILFGQETAQSFSPLSDFILNYFDIDVFLNSDWGIPVPHLYHATPLGEPIGGTISHATSLIYAKPFKPGLQRIRAYMQPFFLNAGGHFCLKIYGLGTTTEYTFYWLYDKAGATYPRGHRVFRTSPLFPWTHYADQDYMFCAWGNPPLPTPDPPPPIDRFAVLDSAQQAIPGGIKITISTSIPCHLTCYWTDKEPLRHHKERRIRGLLVPWGTYFCFVAWHAVEQNEPGDTLSHTFDLTDWEYCQTRWLTYRGEVANIQSPSVGPIFKKHKDFGPVTRYEYYDGASNTAFPTNRTIALAQTFTPQTTHYISQVVLLLSRTGLPGQITVTIQGTTPTGRPDDVFLTSGTFDGDTLPLTPPGPAQWITAPITPYQLSAGVKYAIVFAKGLPSSTLRWRAQDGNPYPRGRAWAWVVGPNRWVSLLTFDMLFEEWGFTG